MFEEELMNLNDWPDPSNKLEFNAADTKLSHAFGKPEWCSKGVRAIYTYDFGDGWEHEITFLGVSDANLVKAFSAAMPPSKLPKRPFLLCITGEGHPCAEDCGGAPAWTELKKLFAKKDKPDPEKRKTWYRTECASGKRSGLDPWKWDINLVNKQLGIYADFICA